MGFHNIEQYSLSYELGRIHATFMHNLFFYKKVVVTGLENIPENEAVILVGNHQNALMDAMAIICTRRWQPVFLARADIFKNPIVSKMLMAIKILPVYRLRDGKEGLLKNEEIFKKNVQILHNKKYFCLMPEASHEGIRKLRLIQKGVSRIALQAEEEAGFNLNLKIVPVGIYYSNYFNFRTILQVNYGKPIEIKDLLETYKVNPNAVHNEIRKRIENGLKPLMIDIQNDKYYQMYESLREIYDLNMMDKLGFTKKNQKEKFIADKKIIEVLDEYEPDYQSEMEDLNQKVTSYTENLKKHNLRDWLFEKKKSWIVAILQFIFMIISFPVFLYGVINSIIPFKLPKLITRNVKDRNFHTSIEFGLTTYLYPIFYLLFFAIVWIVSKDFLIAVGYLISLPFTGLFAFWYWILSIKTFAKFRYYSSYNKNEMENLRNLKSEIISKMDEFYDFTIKKQ